MTDSRSVAPEKFTALTGDLYEYVVAQVREDELLARLRAETAEAVPELIAMQIAPDQGAFMALLAKAIGARRAIELGTFTGYSAICVARALPADGLLVACDVSEEWTAIARRYFAEAGLAERIDLRIAPALDTLAELRGGEPFDFAFIDADKPNYPAYWEAVVELLRPGGIAVVDNVLASGGVVGEDSRSFPPEYVEAIMAVNERIAADERVDSVMLGIADGITVALKR